MKGDIFVIVSFVFVSIFSLIAGAYINAALLEIEFENSKIVKGANGNIYKCVIIEKKESK